MSDFKEQFNDHGVLLLPKHLKITERTVLLLDTLLDFASPEELRRDVTNIYLNYIIKEHDTLPQNFEKTAENMFVLIDFLVQIEDEMKAKKKTNC